jgi:hypothetical protein
MIVRAPDLGVPADPAMAMEWNMPRTISRGRSGLTRSAAKLWLPSL